MSWTSAVAPRWMVRDFALQSIWQDAPTHAPVATTPIHGISRGVTMTLDEIMEVIDDEDFNVTLTGGDPLMHPHTLPALIHTIKERGKSVWLYTGYTIEQIEADPLLAEAVTEVDTIVDGPFITALRDPDLLFRGSSNQRIIDMHERHHLHI